MTSCSQLMDLEELVLGELDAEAAATLRQHVRECAECRAELALLTKERALFANRAEVVAEPPPELAVIMHDRIAAEREARRVRAPSRALAGVIHLFRRGHITAACAAALFAVAGLSRVGAGGSATIVITSPPATITAESDNANRGASLVSPPSAEESLACGAAPAPALAPALSLALPHSAFSQGLREELGVAGGTSATSASLATLDAPLACGAESNHDRGCERASCDPGVTCSAWRQ